jgi:ParB family chromosome partitioning protein
MENFPQADKGASRDELGAMAGVSGKTYEHAVTVIEEAPEPVVEAARQNALSINAAYQVTKMEPEQQREIGERIEHGEKPKEVVSDAQHRPHVTNNSGCNEWYTPQRYIDLAREVLGEIDLDPASCAFANETVKARLFYSEDDDGLTKPWHGRVWMNPPYSADLVLKFAEKFVGEYNDGNVTEGIVLVNNATETAWFASLVSAATAVCFPRGRIRYQSQNRESLAPLQGQAFLYFGENGDKFLRVFSEIGWGAVIYG